MTISWFTLCTLLILLAGNAIAQPQELITPIPSDRLTAATPAQTSAINRIRQRPTTQSLSLVTVNVDSLRGDTAQLTIPNLPSLTLFKRSEDTRSPTDFTWHGTLSGVPSGQATLVVHNGNITGSIQDQNSLYRIEPIGNGVHVLVKVDTGRFPPEHPPSFRELERRSDVRAPPTTRDPVIGDLVGIDVMVPYTTAAKKAVADITATIQLAVAEANQSYVNSGILIKLNLVDSFEITSSEIDKDFDTILADFVADPTVQNHRTSSGADLSALIIDQAEFCGLSDAILATPATAFSIVHYDCATGHYSFAHELGHLMGARHDEKHDPATTPFPYGHGYEHPSLVSGQSFRTIMAYPCDNTPLSCEPRIQYWSSPNVRYNNIATGTSDTNDNVRVLNGTATTVWAFNPPTPVLFTLSSPGLTIEAGQEEGITWEAAVSGWPDPDNVHVTVLGVPADITAKVVQTGKRIPPVQGVEGAVEFTASSSAQDRQVNVSITATSGNVSYAVPFSLIVSGVCQPRTMCSPGQCGSVFDGCNGTLQCGTCGGGGRSCPIGTRRCDPPDGPCTSVKISCE
jgi:hypothetical protein